MMEKNAETTAALRSVTVVKRLKLQELRALVRTCILQFMVSTLFMLGAMVSLLLQFRMVGMIFLLCILPIFVILILNLENLLKVLDQVED